MASNLRKRKETQKVKSAGGQVIHTADRTASGAVAPHQQRESNPDVREEFRKRVQESIGADMTAGVRGVLPTAQREFDRTEAVKRRQSNKDGRLYITQHPERNLNPYAPRQPQQNPYTGGYMQWGTKDSQEFNALARLAQQAGAQKSKRYGDYMKDSAEAMGRKIDLPGFGMRYPGLAAQEYGKRNSELDADTEYIRNKRDRNLSGASDAVRPGEEENEIFKGRGILAPNDRILQNAMLSDEQKRTYNYLYATQGAEEAEKFRDTALEEGGVNAMIAQKAFDADLRNSSYPGKIAATYIGGVEGAADSLAGVPGMIKGEEQYRPRSTAEYFASEAVRSEPEGSLARTGLELAQSAGTNTLAHLASVAGGPALGSAVFAAQAGSRAYNESLMEGHTVGEATAYGAMQALDEEITNYLLGGLSAYGGGAVQRTIGRTPIAQMVGKELQGLMQTETGRYAMRQLMDAIASDSGEAAQEYLQHFTEEFEKWVAYNHTSYDVTTPEGRAALANDLPTRQQIAASLTDPEALHEALIGFLNAGLMNAPGQITEAADIMNRGRNSDLGNMGYGAFADAIDVNPLNYSNPDTYHEARDLRNLAQEYERRNTAGMPTSTFDRGIIDRAAYEFAAHAAEDPRQMARAEYDPYAGEIDSTTPEETTREAERTPPAEEPVPETVEKLRPKEMQPEVTAPTESAAKRLTPEEADAARARWNAEQAERKRDIPDRPYARDEVAYRQLTSEEADAARGELKRLQDEAAAYRADREARAASPRGETTLEDLAQAAGEQQAETRSAQRQAIVDTAQNLDADSLAGAMDNATMLSEAEKQAAYQEGMNNAVTQMRMEAQNEGSGLSGEGSGRTVSLRAGEQNGGVSQTAGGTAESWKDWNRTADTGIHGSDIKVSAGVSAEKVIRTAEPGQTVHVVERGGSPSMRKSAAMIRHYDRKMKVVPFVSRGDIRVKGGETARAFSDPLTRTIGYRANDENALGEELTRHELIEFGIIDGKVDPSEAVKYLSDETRKHGDGNIIGIVSELYARGATANFDSLPAVQKAAVLRHANKEMICDIGAGINQFRGIKGAEMVADLVDAMSEMLSPYMNERLGGAFDAESDTDDEILEDANISVNESGTVAHIEYSTKYSWKTDEEIERAVEALQRSLGVSKKKARAFVESERTLTNLILSPGNVAAMDYEADDRYKAIKKNSDYPQGTVDFNNNCRKRVPFTSVFNRLQMRNPNRVFTAGDLETIRQTLIKDKVPVACALCYVEERRQRLGEIANSFVNLYNNNGLREQFAGKRELPKIEDALEKVGNDPYRPTINDLITYEGLRKLSKEHAGIAEAFEIFNNARGMQAGRLVEGRAEYKRELLKLTKAQVKRINDLGGLRVFSYSDFEAVNLLDIVQIIQDAAVMGIKIQAYTKVPAFAKVVRNTGIKLNRSLIAAGTGVRYENGRAVLDLDPVEGIDINDPDFFDSTDDRDVGNILVGMSDEQIRLAMTSPFVDYIIPFHTSLPNTILKAKGIDHWTNYKLSQTDKDMKTGKNAKNINIYTEVLQAAKDEGKPIRNKRQFVEKFLQVAKEKNLIPRFSQFLNVDKNGNYVYTEGYHKFLIDFKLFDKNGNIVEQEVVRPEFDDAFNTKLMEDFANGAGTTAVTDAIYNDVVNALNEQSDGSEVQYSSKLNLSGKQGTSGQRDSSGKTLTAQQAEYFKDSKIRDEDGNLLVVYHGTSEDFNVFDSSKGRANMDIQGSFFSPWDIDAEGYGPNVKTVYLNIKNPAPEGVAYKALNMFKGQNNAGVKAREYLIRRGYDGVNNGNEEYIAFYSEQIKNIDNENPTDNPDIRYSSKLDLSDLEEEYQEALKANNKDWQLQVVSSAAYKAGYTVGAYHGSPVENIHVFNTRGDGSKKQAKQLLFGTHFTQNLEYAKIYARKAKNSKGTSRMTSREKQVYNVYLDLGKSLDLRTPQNITPGMEEYALYEDAPAKYKKKYPPHTFSKYDTEQGLGSGQFITKATLENVLQAMPPSEAVDFLTNHEYNSVLYDANYATPTSGNSRLTRDPSIIMLDPERIKSGDPITYDDNGNVIPLSERFNPANDDIRYASKLSLTDTMIADLVEKYGALPKGENAQVDVSLPAQTSPGKKTRRYARTVLESGLMSDQMSDEIKKKVINEALSYEPMTDKASAEYAASVIRAGGTAKAQKEWDRAKRSDSLNKDDMAVAQFLLKEYANNGDVDNVIKMVEEISAEATRMGQNIQSLRLLKKYAMQAPEVGLGYIQRTVDQMNRDNKRKMGAKYKEMKIDPALAAEYLNAKTSDEIDASLGKIYKNLGSQVQMTGPEAVIDKLRTWRYLSMLGNPRTHVRNFVGNAIFVPAVRLKNVIGAEIEKSMGAERTKGLSATPEARAFAMKDALLMRDALSGKADMSIRDLIMEQRKVYKIEALNKLSKANSDALEGEDWIFLRMHYQDALAKYITANNMDVNNMDGQKLAKARNYALKEAQKATYRDANKVSAWLNQSSGAGTVVKYMMEGMLPFKKTPTNILRRGVEYSPAGLIGTLTKGTHDLNTGKITLNEYIDGIASGLSGTAIFGVGMFLASVGAILGGYVDDEDKERRKLRGDQEYAVRIGDHTYTVDWAAPGSLPLFIGVETMYGLKRDHGMTFSDITAAATRLVDPMINMSMLSGLNDTLDAISYSDDKLSAFASETFYSLLGQYVPTISGQIARTIDTTQRINYQDKNTGLSKNMLYFIEKMQNKIPYLTFSNDPYLNEFGQENVTESRFVAAIQNFISPGYLSKVKDDRVLDELDRLSETQDENVLPKKMPKYLGTKEDRVDLTSEQYTTFQRTAGQLSYNIIDNMIDDKRYRQLTAEEQAEAISIAYSYAKAAGRIEIQPEYKGKLNGNNKKVYNAVQGGSQAYDVILQIVTSK